MDFDAWAESNSCAKTDDRKIGKLTPWVPPAEAPLIAGTSVDRMDAFGRIATLAGYLVWGGRR